MSDMNERIFEDTTYGQIALQKFAKAGPVDPNFRITECGWLDDGRDVMQVIGHVFRVALRGPRKGQLCVPVPGTRRTVYVTVEEIDQFKGE